MLTALQGHTSWHAWQEFPLQTISSSKETSPSNGLVTVAASTGQISSHHPQLTQESGFKTVFPWVLNSSGFNLVS